MPDIADEDVRVNFVTVVVDSVLYGIVLLLLIADVYFLAMRRTLAGTTRSKRHHFTSIVFYGMTALFTLITAHWTVIVYRAYFAFINQGDFASENVFYSNNSAQPTEVANVSLFFVSVLLGDLLLVHRLWIVWGGNRRVMILPVCVVIGAAVASVAVILQFAGRSSQSPTWAGMAFCFSLINNICSTVLIAFRIWKANPSPTSGLMSFLSILVESAALQTFWLTLTGIAVLHSPDVEPFMADTFPPIIGIANLLIHARVGLGWSQDAVRVIPESRSPRRGVAPAPVPVDKQWNTSVVDITV